MVEFNGLGSIQKPLKMRNSMVAAKALIANTQEDERGSPMGKGMKREGSLVTIGASTNKGCVVQKSKNKQVQR